jgi:succinate dehydrogenase/fumarate reductase flavoprotein subunit
MIAREIAEGRGTESGSVLADYTHIPNVKEMMRDGGFSHAPWWRYPYLEKMGLDPSKDPLEFAPTPHTINTAAIDFNARAETRVPGLYSISGGLTSQIATGKIAAENTTKRANSVEMPTLDWSQVEAMEKKINSILAKTRDKVTDGVLPATVKKMIRDVCSDHCYFWKNEENMAEGIKQLNRIREEVFPKIALESNTRIFNKGLQEYLEAENLLLAAEAFIESCRRWKECRQRHQHTDHTYEDPYQYVKNTYVSMVDGAVQVIEREGIVLTTEQLGGQR